MQIIDSLVDKTSEEHGLRARRRKAIFPERHVLPWAAFVQ